MYSKFRYANLNTEDVDTSSYFITQLITNDNQFELPLSLSYLYDFDYRVDGGAWINNTSNTLTIGGLPNSTPVLLEINPKTNGLPVFAFNNSGDKDKITSVNQIGAQQWVEIENMFYGCTNLVSIASGFDLSGLVNSSGDNFARGCTSLTTFPSSDFNSYNFTSLNGFLQNSPNVSNFNPSAYNVSSLLSAVDFMNGSAALSVSTYESTLNNWQAQSVNNNVTIDFSTSTNTTEASKISRATLMFINDWDITDGNTYEQGYITTLSADPNYIQNTIRSVAGQLDFPVENDNLLLFDMFLDIGDYLEYDIVLNTTMTTTYLWNEISQGDEFRAVSGSAFVLYTDYPDGDYIYIWGGQGIGNTVFKTIRIVRNNNMELELFVDNISQGTRTANLEGSVLGFTPQEFRNFQDRGFKLQRLNYNNQYIFEFNETGNEPFVFSN